VTIVVYTPSIKPLMSEATHETALSRRNIQCCFNPPTKSPTHPRSTQGHRALHADKSISCLLIHAPDSILLSTLRQPTMEKLNLGYSTKNIPIPSEKDYLRCLIEKTEHFLRRMRWKAHFFLHPDQSTSTKENFGFKSTKNPPPINELKDFEDGMMNII